MSLLKRKRVRRLRCYWYRLVGKPNLVTPIPVVGFHRQVDGDLRKIAVLNTERDFLWPDDRGYRGLRLPPPSDREWADRYNEVKNGCITYRPEVAVPRLLRLLVNNQGQPVTSFVIGPLTKEGKICL